MHTALTFAAKFAVCYAGLHLLAALADLALLR
jgi:hypothetical protein